MTHPERSYFQKSPARPERSNEVPADGEQAAQLVRLPKDPGPLSLHRAPTPDGEKKVTQGRESSRPTKVHG